MRAGRLAERLIRLACRGLPEPDRAVRYREWTAEAAAILNDPGTRSRTRCKVRALLFAADHIRGARRMTKQVHVPGVGWRRYGYAAYPLAAYGIAYFSTHWMPVVHSMRLALFELVLVAAMIFQIMRERRRWLAGGTDEFEQGRGRRITLIWLWWVMLWIQLTYRLGLNDLIMSACSAVSGVLLMPLLERRIFVRQMSDPGGQTR